MGLAIVKEFRDCAFFYTDISVYTMYLSTSNYLLLVNFYTHYPTAKQSLRQKMAFHITGNTWPSYTFTSRQLNLQLRGAPVGPGVVSERDETVRRDGDIIADY